MALGNANNSAQSRGKNKPIIVRRRKEVVAAKDYGVVTSSTVQGRDACAVHSSSVTQIYYSGGASPVPRVGDKVYARKRVSDRYLLRAGEYKVSDGRGGYAAMTIDSNGLVSSLAGCR